MRKPIFVVRASCDSNFPWELPGIFEIAITLLSKWFDSFVRRKSDDENK